MSIIADPKQSNFALLESEDPNFKFTMFVQFDDEDDIRSVDHSEFDQKWENLAENVFAPNDEDWTIEEARKYCLSIGMNEDLSLLP